MAPVARRGVSTILTDRQAIGIAAVALVLRIGYVCWLGAQTPLAGDALEYHSYASSLASTGRYEGLEGSRGTRMPGYPLFLSLIYTASGPSIQAVQIAQCFLGTLTCILLYFLGGQLLKPPWPLACGLTAACYYDLFAPSGSLLTEALYSFMLTASFAALYHHGLSDRRRTALGGLGLGLTCLIRPEILPFAAVILCALPFLIPAFKRRHTLTAIALFLLPLSLWTGRNALVFHRLIPASTVGGMNVYLGLRLPLEHQSLHLGPIHQAPESLGELARDADYLDAYRQLCRSVTWLSRIKAYAFNLLSLYYPFLPGYDFTFMLLVPFWLAGLWWSLARRELWPFAWLVLGLSTVYAVLAGPVSRYRFGFAPLLILLAGYGAQTLRERIREPKLFYRSIMVWTAANMMVWIYAPRLRQATLWTKELIWK